jgi:hypothetical protein
VSFLPRPGRTHNSRQIYSFGGINVYLDQDVVYADLSARGGPPGWTPLTLEQLFQHLHAS